jgi:molybdenum cofactor cytidylyltransferase
MGRPKQLLDWHGQPLVRHVAKQALASSLLGLVVVVGASADPARAALAGLDGPVLIVENPAYAAGQAGSLRTGLGALPATARAALVLLVDQPLMTSALINHILAAFESDPAAQAIVPYFRGKRGNPVLLARGLFGELKSLEGDVGARDVLARHTDAVHKIELDDPAVVADMDTPEDYEGMR